VHALSLTPPRHRAAVPLRRCDTALLHCRKPCQAFARAARSFHMICFEQGTAAGPLARRMVRMYRIKEFAAMTGLPPSKIRFYEKHGLLSARREENGYRVFSPEDAFRSNAFRVLLQYGFTVEQAVSMLDAEQGA